MKSRALRRVCIGLLLLACAAWPVWSQMTGDDVESAIVAAMDKQLGSLISHYDATRNRLVVIDTDRRHVAVYDTQRGIELLTSRALDEDLRVRATDPRSEPAPPPADLPGEDPPDGVRLEGSVRYASNYAAWPPGSRTWGAKYYAPGSFDDAVRAVQRQLGDWTAERTTIEGPTPEKHHARASFRALRGEQKIQVEIKESQVHRGWVWMEVVRTGKS